MNITINTKKFAVIGDPIAHSLSPLLYNTMMEAGGIDGFYFPVLVRGDETAEFVKAVRMLKIDGFNATMPHKQNLLSLVDEVDEEARLYGAINTVRMGADGRLTGYNTDVRGLMAAWQGRGVDPAGKRVMMIGAGGVAGALAKGCGLKGAASVTVLNRTLSKAEDICAGAESVASGTCVYKAMSFDPDNLKSAAHDADIIVNCTSLGMSGTGSDFEDLSFLDDTHALLTDLIYNPWETRFLARGRERGLMTINGMDMLIYQGILAMEIYLDRELDRKAEYERLIPVLSKILSGED